MKEKSKYTSDFHPQVLISPYSMSDLQKKILIHICITNNASYETLIEETRRDRITIMQSLHSLLNYHYVEKKRINPDLEKSKVVFFPTHKGKAFAYLYLNVRLTDMIKIKEKDKVEMYIDFIKQVFPSQYTLMLSGLFTELEKGVLEPNGSEATEKELITRFFREGILLLVNNNSNDFGSLSTNKNRNLLMNLFSQHEIRELKEYLIKVRSNLDLYISKFPF